MNIRKTFFSASGTSKHLEPQKINQVTFTIIFTI